MEARLIESVVHEQKRRAHMHIYDYIYAVYMHIISCFDRNTYDIVIYVEDELIFWVPSLD